MNAKISKWCIPAAWLWLGLLGPACEDSGLMTDTIAPMVGHKRAPDSELLVHAARRGDLTGVRQQLMRGADPNALGSEGQNALHAFFSGRNWQLNQLMFRLLMEHGADPNTRARDGRVALHFASERGRTDMLEALIKAGAKVELCDKAGQTPLHRAAQNDREVATAILLAHGAKPQSMDDRGRSPLHLAVAQQAWNVCLALLQAGADPMQENDFGERPMGWVAQRCVSDLNKGRRRHFGTKTHPCIAKAVLRSAALHQAAGEGLTGVVELLLNQAADPSIHYGFLPDLGTQSTALHAAAAADHMAVVDLLLEHGMRPDHLDGNGWTPLHRAVWRGHTRIVEALLEAGAEADKKTRGGDSAFDLARRRADPVVLKMLTEATKPAKP